MANKSYKNRLGYHKVPLLFFHPGNKFKSANTRKITQHADILPTLVDYLNIPTDKVLPLGKSALDATTPGQALIYLDGIFSLVRRDYITELHPDGNLRLRKYKTHGFSNLKTQPPNVKANYGRDLQAYVQYFRNALLDNNLYFWLHPNKPKNAL